MIEVETSFNVLFVVVVSAGVMRGRGSDVRRREKLELLRSDQSDNQDSLISTPMMHLVRPLPRRH